MESKKKIETGSKITYTVSLKVKNVENIFDQEEIESLKQSEILIIVRGFLKDYTKSTGNDPTVITMSSDLMYIVRQALQKESGSYVSSDDCKINDIRVRSGCNVKDNKVSIASWCVVDDDEIIEA